MTLCLRTTAVTALMALMALVFSSAAWAENEIGYVEKFALAPDREKVLGELVPGTEEYYFFHALQYQNTRNEAKLTEILEQWKKRFPGEVAARRVIENREALQLALLILSDTHGATTREVDPPRE